MGITRVLLTLLSVTCLGTLILAKSFKDGRLPVEASQMYMYDGKKETCMQDLGCFRIDPEFYHPIRRPINFLPYDREFINVKYRIYTPSNKAQYYLLPAVSVRNFDFKEITLDPQVETKIITHGWIDNQLFGAWMKEMKNAFFLKGNYNVIIVDWSGGNAPPYTQAVANTRVVGAEIAFLVNTLKEKIGLDTEKVHIMGHSLGGQIVGYAGARIPNLGRITSFDPAEPFYQGMPPSVRIDPTDAKFVEVIHTDSKSILQLGLGMNQLAGHVDHFPNDGMNQPGCHMDRITTILTKGLFEGVRRFVACDHQRAVDYFMDSVTNKCQMIGYACSDWASFLDGKCGDCGPKGDRCAYLGERSIEYAKYKNDSQQAKFYVKTHTGSPFCLYHYHVELKLQRSSAKDQHGGLSLTLKGSEATETFKLGDGKQDLYHGATYTFLITTPKSLGSIQNVSFQWKSSGFNLFSKPKIQLDYIAVSPMFELDTKTKAAESRKLCVKSEVQTGKKLSFDSFC